jgi:hypothetical protein
VSVEMDLGGSRTIGVMGALALARGLMPYPMSALLYYKTAVATWASSWVAFPSYTLSLSTDALLVNPSVVTGVRYLRVRFDNRGYGFRLGKLLAAHVLTDLGVVYAPGSTEETVAQRSRVQMLDGHEVVTEYGPSRRRFSMQFPASNHARREAIKALATDLVPFVLHAPSGEVFECRAIADTFASEAVWGVAGSTASDLWNCALEVESLP